MWDENDPSAYRGCFTLNPSKVGDAMEKLEKLALAEQSRYIEMLPEILHDSLIETLKERGHIGPDD